MQKEHVNLWRDAIDDDAERVWTSIREDVAPPLRHAYATKDALRPYRWLLAAAIAAVMVTGAWNLALMKQLADVHADYVMASLAIDLSENRLATLHSLYGESLSADAVEALKDLVRISQDPNIQLTALDLLLDNHELSKDQDVEALLQQVRHNGHFVEAAVRARSIRT